MKFATTPLVLSGSLLALGSDVVFRRQTQSTPTIFLEIANTQPITVCSSATISWVYVGPNATMTLQITNSNVPQQGSNPILSSLSSRAALPTGIPPATPITITLSTNISVSQGNPSYFVWNPVNLNQGTYTANAAFPSYQSSSSASSQSFLIQASNDTSCLSSTSTPPATSSSATSTPSSTGSTNFPVRTSPSSSTNTGAIAGGVVGGVVFILLVLAFYLYFFRSKRTGRRAPSSYNGGGRAFGIRQKGWGGLSSVDSGRGDPTYGTGNTPQRQRSKLRSTKMHSNADATRQHQSVGVGEAAVNGLTEEETRSRRGSRFSPSKEKFSSSEEIVGMTTLAANGGKRRSDITECSYDDHGLNGASSAPRRWPSVHSTASLPVGARRPSIDSPHTPYVVPASVSTSQLPSSASSPSTDSAPVADFVTSQQDRRKTPRKPVPVYAPSPAPSPPPQYFNPFPSDDFAPRIPSLVISPITFDPEADAKHQRSSGHYSISRGPTTEHELHHKSSFGIEGKPLHYLVPDMPLPPTT